MKHFIIRTLAFSILTATTIGGLCTFEIVEEIRAYRQEVLLPKDASIAISGDSQSAMGVDEEHFPEFFNVSSHGRALDQAAFILKDVAKANSGKLKVAILDITPSNAGRQLDRPISEMGYSAQYYLLYLLHRTESYRNLSGLVKVIRDNMVGRRLRLLSRALRGKRTFQSSLKGGFTPDTVVYSKVFPAAFRIMLKERADFVKEELPLVADSRVYDILDDLRTLETTELKVVLMTTPWCVELREACDQELLTGFRQAICDYAKRRNLTYLDFFDLPLEEDCWRDGHHLSAKGARAFSATLRAALAGRGFLP